MTKANRVAIYVSNRALTGFDAFKFGWGSDQGYNDVLPTSGSCRPTRSPRR